MPTMSKLTDGKSLCTWEYYENREGHKIKGITPHYMAAHWTGKQCADYFRTNGITNSANYCIGYDGDVWCNVYEENGAWTSSSRSNDNTHITIEIGGNAGDPAVIPEKAMEKFKQLATDIALRYGIKKYEYTGKPGANFTIHKMFAATPCPGWYFEQKIPELIKDINQRIASGNIYGGEPMFTDVKETDKHYKIYKTIAELGLMGKDSKGRFKPKNKVTRGSLAIILYRLLKYLGKIK